MVVSIRGTAFVRSPGWRRGVGGAPPYGVRRMASPPRPWSPRDADTPRRRGLAEPPSPHSIRLLPTSSRPDDEEDGNDARESLGETLEVTRPLIAEDADDHGERSITTVALVAHAFRCQWTCAC